MILQSHRFRHWMACLALAAILLLALLPTIGRWVEAGRDAPSLAGMAMCTSDGMAWSPPAALFQAGDPLPTGTQPGADCDYCPLLASAVPVVLATLLLLPPPASPPPSAFPTTSPRDASLAHGLGARGPPRLS